MKTITYTCKFCRRPGTTQFSTLCPGDWVDALHPMIACNRCADSRTVTSHAMHQARLISLSRESSGDEQRARERFARLTRRLDQRLIHIHGGLPRSGPEIVDALLSAPPADAATVLGRWAWSGQHPQTVQKLESRPATGHNPSFF